MNINHDPRLSQFLKETYDKLGEILDNLQTVDRIEVVETEVNRSMKQAILDVINILYEVPSLREQGKKEQGRICKVRYLTLCSRCLHLHHCPPLSPTIPMEDGIEEIEGDDVEDESIEELSMKMDDAKIGGR